MSRLEVSDLIVDHAPGSLERVPVARADVVATLRAAGQAQGARIAARLPVLDGACSIRRTSTGARSPCTPNSGA
ncbi:hypothetical protein [Embleya hyalina]|uniref:hypothetical protein n=1 Tax=Embleya hyalina TaxID=516124 RepID=UPI00135BFC1E|nr:hypothetical protein [Embleya hyalina]